MIGTRAFLLLTTASLAVSMAAAGSARAQERGELMRDTLSTLGLLEKDRPAINYHERPPLVMPPKLDGTKLPPPRARTASPQWPKEPEAVQRERAEEERRNPRGNQIQGRYNDNNATLSVDEMRAGRRADAQIPTEVERKPGDNNRDSFWLNPFEMMKGTTADKTEPSVVEPTRDTLVQPPSGYRKAPRAVARSTGDPVNNASREREEADPGTYLRSQGR